MYEKPANRLDVHKNYTFGPDTYELKQQEGREVYDVIILSDAIDEVITQQDQEISLAIRLLTPTDRKLKYCTRVVQCLISSDPTKYRDRLHVRYQRGLLHPKPWSIDIIKEGTGLMTLEADSTMART
jgi:hypothetical protein